MSVKTKTRRLHRLPKIGDKVVVLVFKEGSGTLEDTHYLFQITKAA
jgi:hypothetical protein